MGEINISVAIHESIATPNYKCGRKSAMHKFACCR